MKPETPEHRATNDRLPIAFGLVATALVASTMVIAGLKAGISPGTSPLVILFAWGAFTRRLARLEEQQTGAATRFLNLAQVAGSAGMSVAVGILFTAPLVQILHTDRGVAALRAAGLLPADAPVVVDHALLATLAEHGHAVPPVDVATLIWMSLAGALIGFGFVGLSATRFLSDPTLPAPEAKACETMIRAAVARSRGGTQQQSPLDAPGEHSAEPGSHARGRGPGLVRWLFTGFGAGLLAPLLCRLGLASEHVVLWARTRGERAFQLDLPFTPIYLGIGGLLTLSTALLVFVGSLLRLSGDFLLAGLAPLSAAAERFPASSMRWVGGAAMTVAVLYAFLRFFAPSQGVRALTAEGERLDPTIVVDRAARRRAVLAIVLGMTGLVGWLLLRDGPSSFTFTMSAGVLACASVMVLLGALLSLQIGASASPLSGTIFVTTLVLCLLAIAIGRRSLDDVMLLCPLLVGACVAVCAANDASQDYKTLQRCGVRVQDGFLAQLGGLLVGAVCVPFSIHVAHEAFVLGSDELAAPQGKMFATLIDGLVLRDDLPWAPVAVGVVLGALAVAADHLARRRGRQVPSMALAVGIYLPAYLGVGILLGALFRFLAARDRPQTNASILTAAGLIAGAAFFALVLGTWIVTHPGFEPSAWNVFGTGTAHDVGDGVRDLAGVLGLAVLGGLLYRASKAR